MIRASDWNNRYGRPRRRRRRHGCLTRLVTTVVVRAGGGGGEDNERLLAYIRDLEPDCIAVVGDLLHEEAQLAMVPAVARGLAAIAPTYYVTGNHEWAAGVAPSWRSC